ncbi:MAG TPA: hypothetical protein VFH46_14090, partial [Pyrinomonadaceae bacterium]|nr:hypothetical protein [Pyrinomonadaceae bacterium]
MIRALTAFVLLLCSGWTAFSQDRAMQNAARNGRPLATEITVHGNVTAQAVLIPRVDARRIFGKEIADNYAVIEVNVGNKSPDAALIIHGVFIDYDLWALNGNSAQTMGLDGVFRERAEPFEASSKRNQIASEEYRVVRGQLLDAQMWTKRNWTMRLLTFAGSLASAYSFSLNEEGIIRGLNSFSGVAVPGLREAWPDGTVDQLNRISDFGYQANKVIPKQGAEVIVCFFPIDRFLTPGFKKLFLKSPALFFAPLQMLVDPTLKNDANRVLKGIGGSAGLTVDALAPLLPCYLQISNALRFGIKNNRIGRSKIENEKLSCEGKFGLTTQGIQDGALFRVSDETGFNKFLALDFISQMSLNSVTVTVDGIMTVNTSDLAPNLDAVVFDRATGCGDSNQLCFWTAPEGGNVERTGIISGAYLTGGVVVIEEANDLGITEVKTISDLSNDQELHFSFTMTKPILPGTVLHFRVSKPQSNPTTGGPARVNSLPLEVLVGTPPAITNVKRDGKTLTVTGSGFSDVPLVVKLRSPLGIEEEVAPV